MNAQGGSTLGSTSLVRLWTPGAGRRGASGGRECGCDVDAGDGVAASLLFVVLLSEAATALLAFLSRRLLVLHTQIVASLTGLFRSRFCSVLRGRQESHAPPLDAVLLGTAGVCGGAAAVSGGAAAHGVPGGGEQSC
jgi:hypothetical protein